MEYWCCTEYRKMLSHMTCINVFFAHKSWLSCFECRLMVFGVSTTKLQQHPYYERLLRVVYLHENDWKTFDSIGGRSASEERGLLSLQIALIISLNQIRHTVYIFYIKYCVAFPYIVWDRLRMHSILENACTSLGKSGFRVTTLKKRHIPLPLSEEKASSITK